MPNTPWVFISHSHEDDNRCAILLETMRDWPIRIWFDRDQLDAGDRLTKRLQDAIEESSVFIRVCTTAMQKRPYWVELAGSRAIPLASSYGDESAVAVATPYLLLTAFYLW